MSDQERDIVDVFDQIREEWLSTVQTGMPAMVTAYDAVNQLVDLQPLIMQVDADATGKRVTRPYAIVPGAPVQWLGSADGTYAQTFPLSPGDTGMLIVPHAPIDAWWGLGRDLPADPLDDRRHDMSDSVFVPGLRNQFRRLAQVASDAWVIAAPKIRLGSTSANGAVVVQAALDDFMSALATAIPLAGTSAPALTALQTALGQLNTSTGWKARTTKTKAE